MVALAAALYATLVGGAFARGVPAAAVLQQTRVPLQTQAVCAETWLPQVLSRVTGLKTGHLCCLGQDLKYGAIHTYNTDRGGALLSERVVLKTKAKYLQLCESLSFWFCSITYCIEQERANKVAKKRRDGAVEGKLCYAKEMLL